MEQEKICSLCNISIEEHYCGRCGQEYTDQPISTITLILDFIATFFSLKKSGFATVIKIIQKPKFVVNNYYSGYKNYYASPGKILFYGIAIMVLHLAFIKDNNIMGASFNAENLKVQYFFWVLILPFIFLASYLTFIKRDKKPSKHIVSVIYVANALFIPMILLNDLYTLITTNKPSPLSFVLFLILVFAWNSRVFTKNEKIIYFIMNTIIQFIVFIFILGLLIFLSSLLFSNVSLDGIT